VRDLPPLPIMFKAIRGITIKGTTGLDAYMADRVVRPDAFVRSDYRSCEESHAGGFYEGKLHHIGRHYDLLLDGQPLRVVVIRLAALAELRGPAYRLRITETCGSFEGLGRLR